MATTLPTTIERVTLYRDHGLRPLEDSARKVQPGDRVVQPVGKVKGTYRGITATGVINVKWDR